MFYTFVCPLSELFYTERAHLRMLKVLDCVFCQRLNRDGILPPEDIRNIFTNLEEIIQLHGNLIHTCYNPLRHMAKSLIIQFTIMKQNKSFQLLLHVFLPFHFILYL